MEEPKWTLTPDELLGKTIVLFGTTGAGKTTIMKDILWNLKQVVNQIIVISKMERQNHNYEGIVPAPLIHYEITGPLLDTIWERQEALVAIWQQANDIKILESMLRLIPSPEITKEIAAKRESMNGYLQKIPSDQHADIEKEFNALCAKFYKHHIAKNREAFARCDLNDDQKICLKYLDLNPELVIIFDDVTDQLTKFKTHKVIKMMFFQSRWCRITALIAGHTDKALDNELKFNAKITILADAISAKAYFGREIFKTDSDLREKSRNMIKMIDWKNVEKLVWVGERQQFMTYKAKQHSSFEFCCQALKDYCERIAAKNKRGVNPSNRYAGILK